MWPDQAMKRVNIADLKDHLSRYVRAAQRGEVIEIADRKRPIARIVPLEARPEPIRWIEPTRPFSEVRDKKYPPSKLPFDVVEILLEDRRKR